MSEHTSLARTARERLAAGLSALQAPGAPEQLMDVAEPIAKAMGVMHQIEKGSNASDLAQDALDQVRTALALLQGATVPHLAVDKAMESVADSLSVIHALTKVGQAAATPASPPPQALSTAPVVARAAAQPVQAEPIPLTRVVSEPPAVKPSAVAANSDPAEMRVQAALGTHSPSNFYKGLSGNDVIDSGGLFVSTYSIPEIGQKLYLEVSLPGGFEFVARGVIMWSRDAPASSPSAGLSPPGYGVRFTELSPEARQLVYRYVRNREPLFHDDF